MQKLFYRIPLITISYSATIVSVIVGALCMAIPFIPTWIGVIICLLILSFSAVSVLGAHTAADLVSKADDRRKMQDLVRGIKKLTESDEPTAASTEQVSVTVNISALLKRMFLFLEDGEFEEADAYCEKILDNDPENDEAYLGKLMAAYRCRTRKELEQLPEPFDDNKDYQKILRFGSEALKTEVKGYVDRIKARNELAVLDKIYTGACNALHAENITENRYREIERRFESIAEYKDAQEKAQECIEKAERTRKNDIFERAVSAQQTDTIPRLEQAIQMFEAISGFLDADACRCRIEELNMIQQQKEAEEKKDTAREAETGEKRKENHTDCRFDWSCRSWRFDCIQ